MTEELSKDFDERSGVLASSYRFAKSYKENGDVMSRSRGAATRSVIALATAAIGLITCAGCGGTSAAVGSNSALGSCSHYMLGIVAGNGEATSTSQPVAGPATSSPIDPRGVAVDPAGDIFIADDAYVEKVTPAGQLSIVAGNGTTQGPAAPGPATSSPMAPSGVAVDGSGNVYIADSNGYVEKVSPAGQLSIVAGTGAGNGNKVVPNAGPATSSSVSPDAVALDGNGNLYIADGQDGYVAKVTPAGQLSVIAGNGDNTSVPPIAGSALSSPMWPVGVAVDQAGDVFIADQHDFIEKVTPAGKLAIVAGQFPDATPAPPQAGIDHWDPKPTGVALDSAGSLYAADVNGGYVEKLSCS